MAALSAQVKGASLVVVVDTQQDRPAGFGLHVPQLSKLAIQPGDPAVQTFCVPHGIQRITDGTDSSEVKSAPKCLRFFGPREGQLLVERLR